MSTISFQQLSVNKLRIEHNVCEYIRRSKERRPALHYILNLIRSNLPDSVIFGGIARDFSIIRSIFTSPSDIDIVANAANDEIECVIRDFSPNQNKFGGFRFLFHGFVFDIWPLSETWAFRSDDWKYMHPKKNNYDLLDLLETTFFNMDSIIFHLTKKKLFSSKAFNDWIINFVMDINFIDNPNPRGMASRAMKRVIIYWFQLSYRLAEYVYKYSINMKLSQIENLLLKHIYCYLKTGGSNDVFVFNPQLNLEL